MSSPTARPVISPRTVADWAMVGRRMAKTRQSAGLELLDVAMRAGVEVDDLAQQEAGTPVLDSFDLDAVAQALETTIGAWFYDDQRAMFRGHGDGQVAAAAEDVGRSLMAKYLATEAVCG